MMEYDELANVDLAGAMEQLAVNEMACGREEWAELFSEVADRLKVVQSAVPSLKDPSLPEDEIREVALRAYRNDPVFHMAVDLTARILMLERLEPIEEGFESAAEELDRIRKMGEEQGGERR